MSTKREMIEEVISYVLSLFNNEAQNDMHRIYEQIKQNTKLSEENIMTEIIHTTINTIGKHIENEALIEKINAVESEETRWRNKIIDIIINIIESILDKHYFQDKTVANTINAIKQISNNSDYDNISRDIVKHVNDKVKYVTNIQQAAVNKELQAKEQALKEKNEADAEVAKARKEAEAARKEAAAAKQEAEAARNEAAAAKQEALKEKNEAVAAKQEAEAAKQEALKEKNEAVAAKQEALKEKNEAVAAKDQADVALAVAKDQAAAAKDQAAAAKDQAAAARKEAAALVLKNHRKQRGTELSLLNSEPNSRLSTILETVP